MVTAESLGKIFKTLISNETICRLLVYGKNPMNEVLDDLTRRKNHEEEMKKVIKFSPQIGSIEKEERVRMCVYKGQFKLKSRNSIAMKNLVIMDLYVPNRLVEDDFRVYTLENKIANILDGMPITPMSELDYSEGKFIPLPPVSGYSHYKMTFEMDESRPKFAKH